MLEVFFAFALIASAISTNKILLMTMPPVFFVGVRMLSAGALLWLITTVKGASIKLADLKRDIITLVFIIVCTTYLPSICKAYALKYMPSSKAAFFGTLDPFVTAFYTYILFNEKLTPRKILGIATGCLGTVVLMFTTSSGETEWPILLFFSFPEIAALLAVVLGRYGWILTQSLLRENKYSPLQINAVTMMGSGLLSLATSWVLDPASSITFIPTPFLLSMAAYTIVVGNVIALTLYATFLKHYSSIFLSLAGFSVPLFVYIYGLLYLQEPPSGPFFLALGLTFLGAFIFYSDNLKK